jgi:hypothetical protein
LYPNQLEVFTEPLTGISKTNKSTLWVESKEIDWSPRSKKQSSSKKAELPAQSVEFSTVEVDEEETEKDDSGVSYELPGPRLDESDEEESEESPADNYVIIGFDTEYVSRKLRRLKTVAENGTEKVIGWLPYTDTDGETELGDEIIYTDPDKNPDWKQQLTARKKDVIRLDANTGKKKTTDKLAIKNELLSYQFWARTSGGDEWNGICIPQTRTITQKKSDGRVIQVETIGRMTLADFVLWALATGKRQGIVKKKLPYRVFLVGHFTRADFCMFEDFDRISRYLGIIRNTFVTQANWRDYIKLTYKDTKHKNPRKTFEVHVHVRDTMLLTPTVEKSLKAIGKMLEESKAPDDTSDYRKIDLKDYKRSGVKNVYEDMRWVRDHHWEAFKQYALQDCFIVVKYLEKILQRYTELTGENKLPVTLTSIGVDLLLKQWEDTGLNKLGVLGQEEVEETVYVEALNQVQRRKRLVPQQRLYFEEAFVTECYHGGRNEQFWFGPGSVGQWNDWDLSSCYPTAMSVIGKPDWDAMHRSDNLKDFINPSSLAFAWVEFKFPDTVMYPVLPVRTDNGIVFPLEGRSLCSAPELSVAHQLGAELKILHGLVVPTDAKTKVFGEFVRECVKQRSKHPKKTLDNLFWKELCNATYGKTAQGLKEKRVYDLRSKKSVTLPPSKITNPFYAAFITSFARAVLGEIMNAIPNNRCVFSCTTDGFLSDATDAEIEKAQQGSVATLYRESSAYVKGKGTVLEIKHRIKQPLGWKTRGQATLIPGDPPVDKEKDPSPVLLAKSSIKLHNERSLGEQKDGEKLINDEVVRLFLGRHRDTMIPYRPNSSTSEMTKTGADLIEKQTEKWVNMEYDWKRVPYGIREVQMVGWHREDLRESRDPEWHRHICFSTRPLKDVEQFRRLRAIWEGYISKRPECLKTRNDMARYASYVNSQMPLIETNKNRYLRKDKPDIQRLKTQLPRAIRQSKAGFEWQSEKGWLTPTEWAATLNRLFEKHDVTHSISEHGAVRSAAAVTFTDQDFRNATRANFVPNSVPRTALTVKILEELKSLHPRFSQIRSGDLLAASAPIIDERELDENRPSKCELIRTFKEPDYRSPGFSKVYMPRDYDSSKFNRKVVAAVEELKARLESRKKK